MDRQKHAEALAGIDLVSHKASIYWWLFFDWLAIVGWGRLLLICFLGLIMGGIIGVPVLAFFLGVTVCIVKIVAGGKRRADLRADAAVVRSQQAEELAEVEALQRQLAEARMGALQAQIEPHFLFNTLSSVCQLMETAPERALLMQKALIRYLRSSLPEWRESPAETSLGQQLELSRAYLDIMQLRMEDRLRVRLEVPESLLDARFPVMMLQTLVENAIKHGLEPKAEGGEIVIGAKVLTGELLVAVSDSGVGFPEQPGQGLGLSNIRERLAMLHGERAQLLLEVLPEGGTRATIGLPFALV
ncbi:LytS/YehU family sensor histidine kinase [Chromobacterium alkanivorans]|uniref:sensor histidine kinase n=1 Tax=Chromobacterium alkanivorans TaxID=1071719 RepID=UPI0019685C5C|nr:histidine kinase [Chromobacterium alkanivorans]MBN3005320.1 histidine kinase [Chromobacterium alkanivorans]MCS3804568.1 LytS/YehU family sensor histidine kinase [Chromobacterium alkanivorans]MCS3818907.1 LytS/YehU family sensor histidine kinase [Chromobacterium alkanivorans]MCS3873235.1 LytS/YehU family sensor histidine kinase [Chromobacterium alkanivorans]